MSRSDRYILQSPDYCSQRFGAFFFNIDFVTHHGWPDDCQRIDISTAFELYGKDVQ